MFRFDEKLGDAVFDYCRERLALDPAFRPRSPAETARVAELARLAGDRALAARLAGAAGGQV